MDQQTSAFIVWEYGTVLTPQHIQASGPETAARIYAIGRVTVETLAPLDGAKAFVELVSVPAAGGVARRYTITLALESRVVREQESGQ